MYALIAGLFGLIAGSFLNALLFRAGTGRSALTFSRTRGRSRCMRCGHTLHALDLIPVLSWLMLGGRCRYCRARISPQYPIVELAAACLLFGVALRSATSLEFVLWSAAWLTLLYTLVYDLRHKVIPWACSGLLAGLGLLAVLLTQPFSPAALFAGPLVALPLLLLSLVSGGRWMGWGDGSMMLGVGWLLGLAGGYSALLIGFWSGALVGIVLLTLQRGYTMRSELPFAPFLILGAGAAYFLNADILAILSSLIP